MSSRRQSRKTRQQQYAAYDQAGYAPESSRTDSRHVTTNTDSTDPYGEPRQALQTDGSLASTLLSSPQSSATIASTYHNIPSNTYTTDQLIHNGWPSSTVPRSFESVSAYQSFNYDNPAIPTQSHSGTYEDTGTVPTYGIARSHDYSQQSSTTMPPNYGSELDNTGDIFPTNRTAYPAYNPVDTTRVPSTGYPIQHSDTSGQGSYTPHRTTHMDYHNGQHLPSDSLYSNQTYIAPYPYQTTPGSVYQPGYQYGANENQDIPSTYPMSSAAPSDLAMGGYASYVSSQFTEPPAPSAAPSMSRGSSYDFAYDDVLGHAIRYFFAETLLCQCGAKFTGHIKNVKSNFKRHLSTISKQFECPSCSKSLNRWDNFRTHVKTYHPDYSAYILAQFDTDDK